METEKRATAQQAGEREAETVEPREAETEAPEDGDQAVAERADEDGAQVRDRPVTVPDLYRTVAHLMGIDGDKSRTSPAGRPIKSVDAGNLISEIV